ncbi:MAG: cadmium-translocating P-type ATPase [Ruminococcus sp.]|nr:cadmium-translocating P-type ATPase [Ruminococcus sp.]
MTYTYTLENLNCAHCAGKIEQKIAATEGYEKVSFNFATKALRFESRRKNTLAEIQAICDSIEDGVTVTDSTVKPEKKRLTTARLLLCIAVLFGVAALTVHLTVSHPAANWIVLGCSLAATLLAGWKVFVKGFKNLIKFNIEETVLMSIAVIAAFILGEYVEGAMVTLLFTIGELIEDYAVDASRRDIEKLSQIRPDTAFIPDEHGHETEVAAASVAVGSEIIVKPHTRIPLDGIVTDGSSTVDNAALTGESIPVAVTADSEVLSGGVNGDGLLRVRTTKAFGDSTAARILQMVEDAAARKGKSEKLISRFASVYTPVVIGIAVLIGVLPPILGMGSFSEWIYNALVVLVASCPCAIVISVPLAYFAGIGAASRQGVLIKGGKYLEALATAKNFVFDKTGTLTTGKLTVSEVVAFDGYEKEEILRLASAAEAYSAHPIARAIRETADGNGVPLTDYRETAGKGTTAEYHGRKLTCGAYDGEIPAEALDCNVFLALDGRLIGAIKIGDTVREESRDVLTALKALGATQTMMLTGDGEHAAQAVAATVGADSYQAGLLPEDKLRAVRQLKGGVCFVGDGINDAPVLSASDCGIAMGFGSEAALEAADAALASGNLKPLPDAVRTARRTLRTVRTNIIFAIAVKAAVIVLACFGLAAIYMSVLADTGVCVLCVLYTARLLKFK